MTIASAPIDEAALRFAVLLFDVLLYPDAGLIPEAPEDWSGLERMGVLVRSRPKYRYNGQAAQKLGFVLSGAASHMDAEQPGQWSVVRGTEHPPATLLNTGQTVRLALEGLIPIPSREVPFDAVLQFRDTRRDELTRLRHHIEEMMTQIAFNGPETLSSLHLIEQFEASVRDVRRVAREANWAKSLVNVELKVNWAGPVVASALAVAASHGLLAGTAIASVLAGSLQAVSSIARRGGTTAGPLDYLVAMQSEFW